MKNLHNEFPHYKWITNKGYATEEHRKAIEAHGLSPYHRRTFQTCSNQLVLELED
jgi:ribonuclease HII